MTESQHLANLLHSISILHRVTLPYACFGVLVVGKKVVDAAPIGKWMVGKDVDYCRGWVRRKKGTMEVVNESIQS